MIDLSHCRTAHDPANAPWGEVCAILAEIEAGARKGAKSIETEADHGG